MDLKKVLALLREERDKIDVAISSLERLDQGQHRGPGRPPNLVTRSATNGTGPALRSIPALDDE